MASNYNLFLKSLTSPKIPPLTLNEVKKFLNIDIAYNDQDDFLGILLNMATEYAEWYIGKSFMRQVWKIACVGYIPKKIYLPCGPIIELREIILGDMSVMGSSMYVVETICGYVEFLSSSYYGKVEITYVAGHETAAEVPALIRVGLLQHIYSTYNNRADISLMTNIRSIYGQFCSLQLTL